MRKLTLTLLTILFCLTSSVVWSETVKMGDLVKRNDLYYKKFTDVPFSGKVKGRGNGEVRNGKMIGPWTHYLLNGQLFSKGHYKDGEKDGSWEWYDKNGKVVGNSTYKDGNKDGFWEWYHSSGQLDEKGHFKDGNQDGLWEYYYKNGELKLKRIWKDGKLISCTGIDCPK